MLYDFLISFSFSLFSLIVPGFYRQCTRNKKTRQLHQLSTSHTELWTSVVGTPSFDPSSHNWERYDPLFEYDSINEEEEFGR